MGCKVDLICFIIVLLLFSTFVFSQDLEPRVYANIPKKFNAIALGYGFTDGNVITEPSLPITDFSIQSHTLVIGYVRTFALANKLARIQVITPFAFMDGSQTTTDGVTRTGSRTGFADARIRFGINLLGSPALERKDFKSYEQKTIVGLSFITSVPIGRYYNDKQINIGSNRWAFKPEVGVSKRFKNFYAEAYTGVWFYTKNIDYFKGKVLEQKMTYSIQAHVSYYFKNKMWIGANTNWFAGGKTFIDGETDGNQIENWRVGGTFSTPLTQKQSIKFQFHAGAFTNNGLSYNAVVLNYQYTFF